MLVRRIGEAIREISGDGVPVLLVEQNAAMALSVAHRAYVLELGRVVLDGSADELSHSDQVRRLYLGGDEPTSAGPPRPLPTLSRWAG